MMAQTVATTRTRFLLIDGLRAVAALAVIVPHTIGFLVDAKANRVASGLFWLAPYFAQGVQVFFVISGFAVAYSLKDSLNDPEFTVGRFILRRSIRLDPPYWVALLAYGLVEALRAITNHHSVPHPGIGKSISHLFYLQGVLGYGQFNVVFWTLCLEFQLYLLFAMLIRFMRLFQCSAREHSPITGRVSTFTLGLFVVSLVISLFVWPMQRNAGWFVPYFYVFLIGVLACWRAIGRVSDVAFLSCVGLMFLGYAFAPDPAHITPAATALFLYVAIRANTLNRWLSNSAIQSIGKISYSIYLLHVPVSLVIAGLRVRAGSKSNAVSFIAFASVYLVTIVLSYAFYSVIEAPCLRASGRLKRSFSAGVPSYGSEPRPNMRELS